MTPDSKHEPIGEQAVERVLELLPDAVVMADEAGRIVLVNSRVTHLLGWRPEDLLGQPVETLVPHRFRQTHVPQREGFARDARARHMGTGVELWARHKDGTDIAVDIGLSPVPTEAGTRVIAVIRDVTERRRYAEAERRLLHADRLIAVGQLAAGVAHEVNNPAAYVMANLSAASDLLGELEHSIAEGDTVHAGALLQVLQSVVDENLEGMERIRRTVGELQGFSRLDGAGIGPTNLKEVVQAAARIVRSELRSKAHLDLQLAEVPSIVADSGRLGQAIVDLLMNAAQAIPDGNPETNHIRVIIELDGERIRLVVEDSGVGMNDEVRRHVFDPFFTTKPAAQATGLGLTLVSDIVHKHGGEVRAQSTPGVGTRMEVLLPLDTGLAPTPPPPSPQLFPDALTGRILLVDDEPHMLEAFERLLGRTHQLETAHNGDEALALLEADSDYDVVISDLVMPGTDGIGLHEAIGKRWPDLLPRLIFMTGGAYTDRAREFLATVDNRVLRKPVDVGELRGIIADVIAGRP